MVLPLNPPFRPMLAKLARTIPDGDGWLFEPKWDGFRCVVFRDGDDIELASRNERPFTRYFPELLDPLRAALPARCVVDGEIVVADGGRQRARLRRPAAAHPSGRVTRPSPRRRDAGVVRRLRPAGARRRVVPRRAARDSPRAPARRPAPGAARVLHAGEHRPRHGRGVVRALRGGRARRCRRQAPRRPVPARQAGPRQGQARAHRRLRGRRLPHPQGRQRRRLAAARPVRRRRRPAERRRGGVVLRPSAAPSCSPSWSR